MPRSQKSIRQTPYGLIFAAILSLAAASVVAAPDIRSMDPEEDVLPLQYHSPLENFRAFDPDEAMLDWKAANDRVGEIGGWRTYLKNAAKKGNKVSDPDTVSDQATKRREASK